MNSFQNAVFISECRLKIRQLWPITVMTLWLHKSYIGVSCHVQNMTVMIYSMVKSKIQINQTNGEELPYSKLWTDIFPLGENGEPLFEVENE